MSIILLTYFDIKCVYISTLCKFLYEYAYINITYRHTHIHKLFTYVFYKWTCEHIHRHFVQCMYIQAHTQSFLPSLYWYFCSVGVAKAGLCRWVFSASSLSSFSSHVSSTSSTGGGATRAGSSRSALAGGVSVGCGGVGYFREEQKTSYVFQLQIWQDHKDRIIYDKKCYHCYAVTSIHTSLKASRRSPASFLLRSFIFLFFFGTETAVKPKGKKGM